MLRGGEAGIKAWNQFRAMESYIPSLEGVDLSGQNLRNANLSGANLKNSNLIISQPLDYFFYFYYIISYF